MPGMPPDHAWRFRPTTMPPAGHSNHIITSLSMLRERRLLLLLLCLLLQHLGRAACVPSWLLCGNNNLPAGQSATPHVPPPHMGLHNELDALLAAQHSERCISVFVFSRAVTRWALNSIYSLVTFGRATNFIVAATDAASLARCLDLGLPCYNATAFLLGRRGVAVSAHKLGLATPRYQALVWGQVVLTPPPTPHPIPTPSHPLTLPPPPLLSSPFLFLPKVSSAGVGQGGAGGQRAAAGVQCARERRGRGEWTWAW